jgi:hypothetical protein
VAEFGLVALAVADFAREHLSENERKQLATDLLSTGANYTNESVHSIAETVAQVVATP